MHARSRRHATLHATLSLTLKSGRGPLSRNSALNSSKAVRDTTTVAMESQYEPMQGRYLRHVAHHPTLALTLNMGHAHFSRNVMLNSSKTAQYTTTITIES